MSVIWGGMTPRRPRRVIWRPRRVARWKFDCALAFAVAGWTLFALFALLPAVWRQLP